MNRSPLEPHESGAFLLEKKSDGKSGVDGKSSGGKSDIHSATMCVRERHANVVRSRREPLHTVEFI